MGLEHEFFLVDLRGEPRDLADLFLLRCREAARAQNLDPRCFEAESVKSMVEITTPPSYGFGEMASHYWPISRWRWMSRQSSTSLCIRWGPTPFP